jgi:diaminopimelate decarboxylase
LIIAEKSRKNCFVENFLILAEMYNFGWWQREDLGYVEGRLHFNGRDLHTFAQSAGTPTFVYSIGRVRENLGRLHGALEQTGIDYRIYYALKCNRFLPLVTWLKMSGLCGIDACSPGEVLLARQIGFEEGEISFTGTSLSNEDLDVLQRHPNVWVNLDSLSAIRRFGERCPGRPIGIRINPQVGAGYHQHLEYAGDQTTKFGIYREQFGEALATAERYGLTVKTLHFHIGSGFQQRHLEKVVQVLAQVDWFLAQCPAVNTLDVGGGLGVPLTAADEPFNLSQWAGILADFARPRGLAIAIEPGDYVMKDAGVLLVQANTVEQKHDTHFVGVNAGFSIQNLYAYYRTPFAVAPVWVEETLALSSTEVAVPQKYTMAGNINEAIDLFAEDVLLPPIAEGDYLALLNVGGYGSVSSSNHCLRGQFSEYLLW